MPLQSALLILVASIVTTSASFAADNDRHPFRPADVLRVKDVGDITLSPDGDWLAYSVGADDLEKDKSNSNLYMVSWDGATTIQLTYGEDSGASHPRFSPDNKYLAFITARGTGDEDKADDPDEQSQVWLLNRAGGEASQLTRLPGGVSDFAWSPDSSRLVLVAKDPKHEVADADDADTGDAVIAVEPEETRSVEKTKSDDEKNKTKPPIVIDRYQFKKDIEGYLVNRYERIYLFDIASKRASLLTPGHFDSTEPAFSPDGKLIAFSSRRNGDPDRHGDSNIYVVEATEGATARQLTDWPGADSAPTFSPDGRQIAYLQGGDPKFAYYDASQIAVIATNGGEPVLPTENLDRVSSAPRWSVDGKSLYFAYDNDRVRNLSEVSAKGGKLKKIFPRDDTPGVVRSFESGANGVAVLASFATRPNEIYRAGDGKALSNHNAELVAEIEWATVEGFDAVSKDGTRVGAILLKPPGFQEGHAYPTIAYVHGGPYGQNGFTFDRISQALAAAGYLVVNPNYRGSSGRGAEFSRAIYADWGNLEIQDIHAVMDALVDKGLADPKRLGIGGWSYGGINTNYAIASDTRFAAAVSGASISNILAGYGTDQYIWQYDNELGPPWESLDTYLKISYPFLHADRIKTPTLFMCGESDFNVPLLNSEQMYQALRSLNVPTELVIYPGQFHGITVPSYVEDRIERMLAWYDLYLKPLDQT